MTRVEWTVRLAAAVLGIGLSVAAGYLGLSRMGDSLRYLSYDLPFLAYPGKTAEKVSGRFHILCGRFDWDLPICCVFLS